MCYTLRCPRLEETIPNADDGNECQNELFALPPNDKSQSMSICVVNKGEKTKAFIVLSVLGGEIISKSNQRSLYIFEFQTIEANKTEDD